MSSKLKHTFIDIIVYTLSQIILRLRGLIILPLFAHKLGVKDYGIFTQISLTIALIIPLVSLRLDTAAVRFLSSEKDNKIFKVKFYTALILIVLSSWIASLIVKNFSSVIAHILLGSVDYAYIIAVTGLLLITSSTYSYLHNYFRIVQKMKFFSAILLTESILETLGIFWIIYHDNSLVSVLWILIKIQAFFIMSLLIIIYSKIGFLNFNLQCIKEMITYGIPLIPNGSMYWIINYSDRICITHFLGATAVGAYSASYSLGMLINLIIMPIGFVLFPVLSRIWDREKIDEVCKYFNYLSRYYLLLSFPFSIFIAYISQPLINMLTNSDFKTNSILVFFISLGFIFNGLFQINCYAFHLVKKTWYVTSILIFSSLSNILLNILLIPKMNLTGAALATTITFMCMAIFAVIYGQKLIGYHVNLSDMIKGFIATLIMAALLLSLPSTNFVILLFNICFCLLIYIVLLYGLKVVGNKEILFFKSLMQ